MYIYIYYIVCLFLRKYFDFGITKIAKLGVFELRPDSTHLPNVSTRVPKSTYPSKYVDFSPDKLSLEGCIACFFYDTCMG